MFSFQNKKFCVVVAAVPKKKFKRNKIKNSFATYKNMYLYVALMLVR
jgi:hypothetical protein